jgi:hypothetical protein
LDGVGVEGRAVGADVDALVVAFSLLAEDHARVAADAGLHGDVHLDDAVLEDDILELGASLEGRASQVLDDLAGGEVPLVLGEAFGGVCGRGGGEGQEKQRAEGESSESGGGVHGWVLSAGEVAGGRRTHGFIEAYGPGAGTFRSRVLDAGALGGVGVLTSRD